MSQAVARLLSRNFTNIRGLLNPSSKAIISQEYTGTGFPHWQVNKCNRPANYHTHHDGSSRISGSINFAAIFNSTKLNIIDPITREQNVIDPRIISNVDILDTPKIKKIIDEPDQPHVVEKQAHRMINIRRRKMKKHKLKKLRKRMKFEWKKKALKREKIKEKAFYMELYAQIRTAETFSPQDYAAEQRKIIKQTYLPLEYEKMPQWYLKETLDKEKRIARETKEHEEGLKALAEFQKTYKWSDKY
nr:PREDICTED: uncharacterized protein LOC109034924 [Bemisia tabaci]